jgi:hypothetical protein
MEALLHGKAVTILRCEGALTRVCHTGLDDFDGFWVRGTELKTPPERTVDMNAAQRHALGLAYTPALAAKLKETGDSYSFFIQCAPDYEFEARAWAEGIGFPVPDACLRPYPKAWRFEARFRGNDYGIPCEYMLLDEGTQQGKRGNSPVGIRSRGRIHFNWKEIAEELLKAGIAWRSAKTLKEKHGNR